jgi:hypothetical protein
MLGQAATIETTCPLTGESFALEIGSGGPERGLNYVVRFGVPAARWWQDIGHT